MSTPSSPGFPTRVALNFVIAVNTTATSSSNSAGVSRILGRKVRHRTNQSLNNRIEQDQRGIKQRYDPMRGFGSYAGAARFCTAFCELRQYFRLTTTDPVILSMSQQRQAFCQR